jgi:hypothetical protein
MAREVNQSSQMQKAKKMTVVRDVLQVMQERLRVKDTEAKIEQQQDLNDERYH